MHHDTLIYERVEKSQRYRTFGSDVTSAIRKRVLILALACIFLLSPLNTVDSFPNGVGDVGNEGCLCHGASNSNTEISLLGLPEKFASATNYSLQLVLSNEQISQDNQSAQGGFRIILNQGTLYFNESEGAMMGDGWTHQESSNQQRSWNFSWLSPNDNTTMAKFLIYGNAVNGNGQQTGDHWNSAELYIPGEQNFDPIPTETKVEHELEIFDRTMLISGLVALLYICYRIIRD